MLVSPAYLHRTFPHCVYLHHLTVETFALLTQITHIAMHFSHVGSLAMISVHFAENGKSFVMLGVKSYFSIAFDKAKC